MGDQEQGVVPEDRRQVRPGGFEALRDSLGRLSAYGACLLCCSRVWSFDLDSVTYRCPPVEKPTPRAGVLADLERVRAIDRELEDQLPLYFNQFMSAGVFQTPSARMFPDGTLSASIGQQEDFRILGLGVQFLNRLELSLNYRTTLLQSGGAAERAVRTIGLKGQIVAEGDAWELSPALAVGARDLLGQHTYRAAYVVATQRVPTLHLEGSFGWGWGAYDGPFGSLVWTPLHRWEKQWWRSISLAVEWDPTNKPAHCGSHLNYGLLLRVADFLQLAISRLRGEQTSIQVAFQMDLGHCKGWVPKFLDRPAYQGPVNLAPIGPLRAAHDLALELKGAFLEQGLLLQGAWIESHPKGGRALRLRVVNQIYRWETEVRSRFQQILGALVPTDLQTVTVIINAYGADTQQYTYRVADLRRFVCGQMGAKELAVLTPLQPPQRVPSTATPLYRKPLHATIWSAQPYYLTGRTGGAQGLRGVGGLAVGPQGYLWDHYFYRLRANVAFFNRMEGCADYDLCNPSPLPNVRSDGMAYAREGYVQLQQAFLQRTWSSSRGWYGRVAAGYFDLALAGAGFEVLWFPVGSSWAVGLECSPLIKRQPNSLGVTLEARRFCGDVPLWERFLPYQAFLDLYYVHQPWQVDARLSIGSFLAHDFGARCELGRYWPSGLRVFLWATVTNGRDCVHGKRYLDKGIGFSIPIDLLLPRRSRGRFTYANTGYVRDVGQRAVTGVPLFWTILEERLVTPGYAPE